MKEKIIFVAITCILIFLYISGSNAKKSNVKQAPVSNIQVKSNLSVQRYDNQLNNTKDIEQKNDKITNNVVSKNSKPVNQDIFEREKAVFEELKRQQQSQMKNNIPNNQYNQSRMSQVDALRARMANVNSNMPNQNNYSLDKNLAAEIEIDKPPTMAQVQEQKILTREYYIDKNLEQGDRDIPINQPTALSYKTRQEVFTERKKYVSESLFAHPNYDPSRGPIGQIESGKPWISTNLCRNADDSARVDGASEETRFLNNPSVLIGLQDALNWRHENGADDDPNCHKILLPYSARYIKNEKVIEVVYRGIPIIDNREFHYQFVAINAKDFGYEYAHLDNNKSENAAIFTNFNSLASSIVKFQDVLHRGGSCGVQGGCNNGSPHQPMLEFDYDPQIARNKVVFFIKLWRQRPNSFSTPADINERIILLPQ